MSLGGGTPGGSNAGLFLPPGQGQVAGELGSVVGPMANQGINALNALGGVSPAQSAYPFVQGTTSNVLNNPYAGGPIAGGQAASDIFSGQILPYTFQSAPQLQGIGNFASGITQGIPGITFNNPAYASAATTGAELSPQFAGSASPYLTTADQFRQLAINNPNVNNAIQYGQGAAGQAQQAAGAIQQAAFDPQQALYQRTLQQLTDQENAQLAASGVGGTPYGQGVLGKTLSDYNIDWQNRQLGREIQGGNAATNIYGAGLGDLTQGIAAQLQNAAGMSGAAGALAGTGINLGQEAISSLLGPANAQTAATLQGTSALGNLASTAGGAYGGALNSLTGLAQGAPGFLSAPYNAYQGIQGNNFGALQNEIALGNQNYALPQQTIGNLEQYLGLGQNASQLANSIGATNFGEAAALGGGTINALGGINNLTGGGITNLFGGGTGGAAGIGADFGGGGAALGVPDALGLAGGGGDALAAAAPLAFS